ncbi:hypothetical protein ACXZ65_34540 [Streptomyces aculeolatus]
MSVTINAHQLGRLINDTRGHIGNEYIEPLNGIRLDTDSAYLYAVASDSHTLAVSRYGLRTDDKQAKPFARTIPADHLPALHEWIGAMKGATYITITPHTGRLSFESGLTTFSIATNDALTFPDWRGLLRSLTEQTLEGEPFPALDSRLLQRFESTGRILRTRVTSNEKGVLLFGDDFIGAQMPARHAGVGPAAEEPFDTCRSVWQQTLAAGGEGADMERDMPAEEDRPRYESTTDVRETGGGLLQVTLDITAEMFGKSAKAPELFRALVLGGCHGWMAYRYLDALYNADPRLAEGIVAEVASELDSGEIGEFAWDAAESAGFDPKKWVHEREERTKKPEACEAQAASTADPPTSSTHADG